MSPDFNQHRLWARAIFEQAQSANENVVSQSALTWNDRKSKNRRPSTLVVPGSRDEVVQNKPNEGWNAQILSHPRKYVVEEKKNKELSLKSVIKMLWKFNPYIKQA